MKVGHRRCLRLRSFDILIWRSAGSSANFILVRFSLKSSGEDSKRAEKDKRVAGAYG